MLSFLLAVFVIMQGCQIQPEAMEEDAPKGPVEYNPNAGTYIASVQALVDAMLAGDSVALSELTSDDFISIFVTNPMDTASKAEFINDWVSFQTLRSNQQNERLAASALKVNEGDYIGDWVQMWGNYSATLVEQDTSVLIPYFVNLKLTDGKISRMYGYYDRVPIWQAVGYEMIPPN